MANKKITVYDIAAELGISASTVSRVLNNSSLISDVRTREILEVAEKLGYRKRSIKKHQSRVILNLHLFLPKTDNHLTHFFYNISELIDSIQNGFGDVRLNFISRVNDGNLDFLKKKKTGQIDGCIFAFTSPDEYLAKELNSRSIPYILLNRSSAKGSYVCYDIPGGIRSLAMKMKEARGEKLNPCYLGFSKLPHVSRTRFDSACNFFKEENIPFDKGHALILDRLEDIPTRAVDWVLEGGFNGVIAFNDLAALSFLQSGLARGVRFPEEILLSGFDDSPIQTLLDRRIDTVRISIPALGARAGEWLKSCIIDREEKPLQESLPVEYIQGDTIF